jgi:hypothetical protein
MDTIKHCRSLLEQSGWRLDAIALMVAGAVQWRAIADNGSKRIEGSGETLADAWLKAVEQAKVLGMLRQ